MGVVLFRSMIRVQRETWQNDGDAVSGWNRDAELMVVVSQKVGPRKKLIVNCSMLFTEFIARHPSNTHHERFDGVIQVNRWTCEV